MLQTRIVTSRPVSRKRGGSGEFLQKLRITARPPRTLWLKITRRPDRWWADLRVPIC
jgi:hypothetical protein